ncbi:MAG: hemagglutinin repeat-containing protein [Campylobacterales bacterium]|nr:hemagglutinin repeat-containing protein [Campylobacterales bacterium]
MNSDYNFNLNNGYNKGQTIKNLGSTINANNISVDANTLNIKSSNLNAKENIGLNAVENVNILATNDLTYQDTQTSSKGFLSKKTQRDMIYKEDVVSSNLNAKNILINSDKDITLEATKLKAQDNIGVFAKEGDVNILAKEYKEGELHQTSKSSWGGLKKSVDIKSSDALKLNSALLETQAANVVITSGKDINILASEINSGADIQLKALENVLIASQSEYLKTREVHEKSSFNLKGLTGLLGSDENIYSKELTKNDKLSSSSVSSSLNAKKDIIVDSGSTTIIGSNLEANNIEIKADTGEINILSSQDVQNSNYLNKKLGIGLISAEKGITQNFKDMFSGETKIKFEVGRLEMSEFDKSTQSVINNSSNLKARENLILDSLSDINVVGSNLKSDSNLVLNSQIGDINILNSIDTLNEDIKEKSFKASVSATVQNEYVEIGSAVKNAIESAKQLKEVKEDYSNYKGEVKKLENTLSDLKQRYKNINSKTCQLI